MSFDVMRVRAAYPALGGDRAWLDAAAGTQVPESVIQAIADAYRAGIGNVNGVFPTSHLAEATVDDARAAVADLVGGQPENVIFGANMTTLTYRLAATLARTWRPGENIVVSRLDHDANVRPWVQAAEAVGVAVRWADIDPERGELPTAQFGALVDPATRLVAVTAASNILGTVPDLAAILAAARGVGALTYVDGVHATPHRPVDIVALGCDLYATSAYKWCGPHVGAVIARAGLLETLWPDKLAPAPVRVPDRFETGTPPFADLAAVTAAVNHLAQLDPDATGSRRERIVASMTAVEEYEQAELRYLLDGLAALPKVRLIGAPARRTATAFFTVEGYPPREVARMLAADGVNVWSGHSYAWELVGALGLRESGGGVRAGLVHYNLRSEVDCLLRTLEKL